VLARREGLEGGLCTTGPSRRCLVTVDPTGFTIDPRPTQPAPDSTRAHDDVRERRTRRHAANHPARSTSDARHLHRARRASVRVERSPVRSHAEQHNIKLEGSAPSATQEIITRASRPAQCLGASTRLWGPALEHLHNTYPRRSASPPTTTTYRSAPYRPRCVLGAAKPLRRNHPERSARVHPRSRSSHSGPPTSPSSGQPPCCCIARWPRRGAASSPLGSPAEIERRHSTIRTEHEPLASTINEMSNGQKPVGRCNKNPTATTASGYSLHRSSKNAGPFLHHRHLSANDDV